MNSIVYFDIPRSRFPENDFENPSKEEVEEFPGVGAIYRKIGKALAREEKRFRLIKCGAQIARRARLYKNKKELNDRYEPEIQKMIIETLQEIEESGEKEINLEAFLKEGQDVPNVLGSSVQDPRC